MGHYTAFVFAKYEAAAAAVIMIKNKRTSTYTRYIYTYTRVHYRQDLNTTQDKQVSIGNGIVNHEWSSRGKLGPICQEPMDIK